MGGYHVTDTMVRQASAGSKKKKKKRKKKESRLNAEGERNWLADANLTSASGTTSSDQPTARRV